MKPGWMIQTNIEGVDTSAMIAEVERQGMKVIPFERRLRLQVDFSVYNPHDCIICYGDIDFVRLVHRMAPFIPGVWCNFDNMKCSTYYAYLGEHLLNQQYIMMPIGDLLRRYDELITYATDQSWFLRPDSGAKLFTGYVIEPDVKHKVQTLAQVFGPETLIILAPERNITSEFRFVICNRKVVAGCQYLPHVSTNYPSSSFRLADVIASQEWQPDLCYTVDIVESDGEMYLLEINSFSCAGFYDCGIASIVEWASKSAYDEWAEYCDSTEKRG